MKVYNFLPVFMDCLRRWEEVPSFEDFRESYYKPLAEKAGNLFDHNPASFYSVFSDLNWKAYRDETLLLDPLREENRVLDHLQSVEDLFGFKLEGEVILFSSLACMDGYARFDRGTHRVYLGVDESHGRGAYLDVLETHELTHVARESRPSVWEGFGLNPKMTHDEFTENQPVIEHLVGEGFSCVVSEILVPGQSPWAYAYQTEDSLAAVLQIAPAIDRGVHAELRKSHHESDYSNLYSSSHYRRHARGEFGVPSFSHYVWAWQWVKSAVLDFAGGDPRKFVTICSKDLIEHALAFELREIR